MARHLQTAPYRLNYSKSKPQEHSVMEGTLRLCAFLLCVSKSKPQEHIVMEGTLQSYTYFKH